MSMLDDMLNSILEGFARGLHIEGDRIRVNLMGPAAAFEIWFEAPNSQTVAEIKAREGKDYSIPVRIRLVNRNSGKDVRGFNDRYINAWWLHTFVFEIAAAVAYMEREWDILSPAYIEKMNNQDD